MKKILKTAALFGLLTLVLLATVSCKNILGNLPFLGDNSDTEGTTPETTTPSHSHAFGDWQITQDATCTKKGQQERTCSCGEKEIQEIAALDHTEVIDSAVAPTCTTDGLTAGSHCSACGQVLVSQETVPATHNWMQTALLESATCFTYGEEHRACRVCGVEEDAPVEPLAHNFVMDEETQFHTCSLCNGILFAGHFYAAFEGEYHWVDAYELCEEMGGHLVTITSEHEQSVITYLMNLEARIGTAYWIGGLRFTDGFRWITQEIIEYQQWAPGQPSGGEPFMAVQSYKYSSSVGKWHDLPVYDWRLGYVCEWELNITECEHIFTEWEITVEPTCWNDGEQYRTCSYCGAEESEILPQLEHNFVSSNEAEFEMCEYCKAAKHNGHIYVLFTDKCNWFDAYSYCEALGGHLVTITSEEEDTFVAEYFKSFKISSYPWIGAYYDGNLWQWITDEAFEYTHWKKGEPSNNGGKEWVAHLYNNNFEWNDEPPTEKYVYICEFDCEE
ncbi:MAG: C-type lectin domain-containing protein [Clostridia bacterium]|nr:C-type lectin domain-containing protein [Clostridia bacterium]